MFKKLLCVVISIVCCVSVASAQTVRTSNVHGRAILSAAIDVASSGDNTLVAAVSGKKICVIGVVAVAAGAVVARFEDGAGGTALSGQMTLAANGGFVLPQGHDCWFKTSDNTLLNLELDSAVSVDGVLNYILID